jgi:uncharacterized protein YecT (DUF1311 family)
MRELVEGFALLLWITSAPAQAMDCFNATSPTDKRFCADHPLKAADDEMSAIYSNLLANTNDPEIQASLVEGQRRWIEARERDLRDLPVTAGDDPEGRDRQRAIALQATRSRIKFLSSHSGDRSDFVATAVKQRQLAHVYSGGLYAGYVGTYCEFIPEQRNQNRLSYRCFGTRAYQNGHRVCLESNDFANNHIETTRQVVTVENGAWKPLATFSFPEGRWIRSLTPASPLAAIGHVSLKVDPDAIFDSDDDKGWMNACLTDPSFPHDVTRGD